jgi:hypothetical protein
MAMADVIEKYPTVLQVMIQSEAKELRVINVRHCKDRTATAQVRPYQGIRIIVLLRVNETAAQRRAWMGG